MQKLLISSAICIAIRLVLGAFLFDGSDFAPPWHQLYLLAVGFSILFSAAVSLIVAWKSDGRNQKLAILQMAFLIAEPYFWFFRAFLSFRLYD
ncbi:MAG: hypothetical protein IPK79_10870 [Vampirovibrionales bacterium]|nr:hypothetical protein [Vampirovibrionales bacterium]